MHVDSIMALKTSLHILEAIQQAAQHKPSAEEVMEQRVSFVFGSLRSVHHLTKAQVRQITIPKHIDTMRKSTSPAHEIPKLPS